MEDYSIKSKDALFRNKLIVRLVNKYKFSSAIFLYFIGLPVNLKYLGVEEKLLKSLVEYSKMTNLRCIVVASKAVGALRSALIKLGFTELVYKQITLLTEKNIEKLSKNSEMVYFINPFFKDRIFNK